MLYSAGLIQYVHFKSLCQFTLSPKWERFVGCPEERREVVNAMHHSVGNSPFCQAHALKSGHLLQLIANLLFVCFICRNFIPSQIMSLNIISWNFIYNTQGIFKSWQFYCSHPFGGNKQSVHIVSFPAGRVRSRRSSGHLTDCKIPSHRKSVNKNVYYHCYDIN